jgi:hypothetical protein
MPLITPAQLIKAASCPGYVKVAHVDSYDGFPVNSKEATYVSFASALCKGASGDDWQNIEDHVRFWGITDDCVTLKNKYAALNEVTELPEADYAMVAKYAGEDVKKFPIFDTPSLLKSAMAFYDARDAFPYAWRNEAATKFLVKAAELKAELPRYLDTYLQKAACFGAVGVEELETALIERDNHCSPQHRDAFEKVAELLDTMMDSPELRADHDFVKEAFQTLDSFDSMIGYYNPVENLIPDELVVSKLEKVASEEKSAFVTLTNGKELDLRTLDKTALDMIDDKLSKLAGDELRGALETLPRPDAELLTRYCL